MQTAATVDTLTLIISITTEVKYTIRSVTILLVVRVVAIVIVMLAVVVIVIVVLVCMRTGTLVGFPSLGKRAW